MPNAKYQLEDFLVTVDADNKDFVLAVHEILLQSGYKLKVQVTKSYGLHVSYAQPKIKTVKGIIAYFLVSNGKLMIRINADNYAKYPDILTSLPENIVNQIDKANVCIKLLDPQRCWQGCGGYDFYIGGKHYQKCIINCFLLEVDAESFPFLVKLIKSEAHEREVN